MVLAEPDSAVSSTKDLKTGGSQFQIPICVNHCLWIDDGVCYKIHSSDHGFDYGYVEKQPVDLEEYCEKY